MWKILISRCGFQHAGQLGFESIFTIDIFEERKNIISPPLKYRTGSQPEQNHRREILR